jgi:hypothetical protein
MEERIESLHLRYALRVTNLTNNDPKSTHRILIISTSSSYNLIIRKSRYTATI